ncbi:MAG: RDD family protein [Chloroflexi bacterium]|nr:RDD family protein [Chloroflexota bacterium]
MSHAHATDPITLVAGPDLAPSVYRCAHCRAIEAYAARLPTGGVLCKHCGAMITSTEIVDYATTAARLVALACDVALLIPPIVALLSMTGWLTMEHVPEDEFGDPTPAAVAWMTTVFIATAVTVLVGYLWYGNSRGQTVGKRFTGLKVVRLDTGGPLGAGRGSMRTLAQLVTIATLGLGYAIAFFDPQRRTLHDRIAGTLVIEP